MKPLIFTFTLILAFIFSGAQTTPPIEWKKCLGGSGEEDARFIEQTNDGGYIVAGYTGSIDGDVSGNHGQEDYWIVKLDISGNIEWQKCLGGNASDAANSIQQTTDGGYVVAGTSSSINGDVSGNHGLSDYWIVKLDFSGNIEWQKCLGGSNWDEARSVLQTDDGGFIVAGYTGSTDGDITGNHGYYDYWIVKLDASGSLQWQKCLGGSYNDDAYSIQQTDDGGFVVAGESISTDGDVSGNHGNWDDWLVKLDVSGNIEWQKCLGGGGDEGARSIEQTTDGGYIVSGYSWSDDGDVSGNNGGFDYWIVKLDMSGNIEWQKCLGGSSYEEAHAIRQTSDGGYLLAGDSNSSNGDVSENHGLIDYWIVKLDVSGNIEWQKSMGGSFNDKSYSIRQTTDGGKIVAGYSNSPDNDVSGNHGGGDYWITKLLSCDQLISFYADSDNDEYGDSGIAMIAPVCAPPAGYVFDSTDCNDNDSAINPSVIETCNSLDDNCNGLIDEGVLINYYFDEDDDGYGDPDNAMSACSPLSGYVTDSTDCDDGNDAVHPAALLVQWQNSLGGYYFDYALCSWQTTDGGYMVGGSSSSNDGDVSGNHGGDDSWIVKLDTSGNIQWQKCLGGSVDDAIYAGQQTADEGFVVAGYSESNSGDVSGNHGGHDSWIVKLDIAGNIQWQKCLGGSEDDVANSMQQTTDQGFILAGYSKSNDGDVSGNHGGRDYWIVKLNSSGSIEWQKCLGGMKDDEAGSIHQTANGGFVVAGSSQSNDGDVSGWHEGYDDYGNPLKDYWIVKLDASGNIMWQKCFGGSYYDVAYSIQQTADEGYVVAGWSNSLDGDVSGNHGSGDYWIVKLDALGNIQWQKCFGGSDDDVAQVIQQITYGGYVVAGWSNSLDGDVSGNHGQEDYWIVKLDFSGNIEWEKSLGGSGYDLTRSVRQTDDGGLVVAGWSNSLDGDVSGNHGNVDYWIVKLAFSPGGIEIPDNSMDDDCDGEVDEEVSIGQVNNRNISISVFPNPTDGKFIIDLQLNDHENATAKIEVLNLLGQVLIAEKVKIVNGKLQNEMQLNNMANGIYVLKVTVNDRAYIAKIDLKE